MDSDFDVNEAEWGPDDGAEERILKEEKKKKKQWIKPFKQPVSHPLAGSAPKPHDIHNW